MAKIKMPMKNMSKMPMDMAKQMSEKMMNETVKKKKRKK